MDEKNEFELVVSERINPIWKTIIAAGFFTTVFYLIVAAVWNFGFKKEIVDFLVDSLEPIFFSVSGGIAFSVRKMVLNDIKKDKLISRYFIGPFSKDYLSIVPKLGYMSIFLNLKEYYVSNLWYKGNKHYKMYQFDQKLPAMKLGFIVANKLNIQSLDATIKGKSKWIKDQNVV